MIEGRAAGVICGDRLDGKSPQYSEIAGAGGASLTLVVETGVPLRAAQQIEPLTIDMEPNGAEILPAPADTNGSADA